MDEGKRLIIDRFMNYVYGKSPEVGGLDPSHDGRFGHWLERQMGIEHNANNEPDLYGYEMKNETTSKTSFGDWSADYYIYKHGDFGITRSDFLRIFGKSNPEKAGRFSWSGEPIPKVNRVSSFNGSRIETSDGDIAFSIVYNYSDDPRVNKSIIVPDNLKLDNLVLASWTRSNLENKLKRKFSNKGWFRCRKGIDGTYQFIEFGEPMIFENWLELVNSGIVFLDSGMFDGNPRNYSQWRASNRYWDSLVIETYPDI